MDYGISNKKGKIPRNEVFKILNAASEYGIDTLDTAYLYGESESVIGDFNKENRIKFNIVTKSPDCDPEKIEEFFDRSLDRLKINNVYGYLIHDFQYYLKNPEIWNVLERLKQVKRIKKIGFSLYYPHELEHLLRNNINIDLIQIPYNIFDQRFEPFFNGLKKRNVEIHARSVFLQGLVFKKPEELDSYFARMRNKISNLNLLSVRNNIPVAALCLDFAVLNNFIDRVVVGIESIENLKQNISSLDHLTDVEKILNELSVFKEDDENMILPFKWKVK